MNVPPKRRRSPITPRPRSRPTPTPRPWPQHLIPEVRFEQEQIALAQLQNRMQIEQQRVVAFGGSMQAQLDAVKAQLQQQQSNLQLRQRQADALEVKAGIAGVLQEVAVQEGAQVAAGANLARVARTDVLIARLQVPEVQAKDVAMGMPVSVDTHNGLVDGKVERIDPAVRDGSVQVDVHLAGTLPPGARPDLSVDGRIRIARLDDVLSVGRPALAKADGDISLFRLDPSGGDRHARAGAHRCGLGRSCADPARPEGGRSGDPFRHQPVGQI